MSDQVDAATSAVPAPGAPAAESRPALRLLRLRVRKTPGIEGAFALGDFSPGVNLVHGPNASGKTSTARAIEAILWPDAVEGTALTASAEYGLGAATYHIDVDAGHVGVQRDGSAAHAPALPAPELRQRYHLSLHHLLAHDRGQSFAAEIARQSAGGYDLGAAVQALGFRSRPPTANNEARVLEQARERLKEATDAQARLHQEARDLDELARRRDAARLARDRAALLAHAVRHARLAAEAAQAQAAVDTFPEVLAKLRGNEQDALGVLREDARKVEAQLHESNAERDAAAHAATTLFADAPPASAALHAVRTEVESLRHQEQAVADAERRERDLDGQAAEARRVIGSAADDARLARIDGVTFGELADFARQAERLRADANAVEAELRRAGSSTPAQDLDAVRAGTRLLAQWLADGALATANGQGALALVWAVAILAVLGWLLVAVRWHGAAYAVAVVPLVLAFLATRRRSAVPDPRASREREYARLGLPRPNEWEADQVRACLDTLQRRLADGEIARARADWRDEARQRRQELSILLRELEARRAKLVERFGASPDADERHLSWFADQIGRWQDVSRSLAGARAALATARVQLATTLASVGERVRPFGYASPASAADALGTLTDLERRVRDYDAARERESSAERRQRELEVTRRELMNRCAAIFKDAGVAPDDDAALAALCTQSAAFTAAREKATVAARARDAARAELEETPGFAPALLDQPASELEAERAEAEQSSGELEALTERMSVLGANVERARQGSDVEAALADVTAAQFALHAAREGDLRAMLGDVLVRHVQKITRDAHRPAVFHGARELFARITRGRYQLEFADGDEPAFRAVDVETGRGHALDELSSATRVQLLLAVRVAFVETQEHGGTRLPLLLDETLGTSDDQRAEAIIDAVITLAENGRQIFYFTAQRDEVGKWLAALEARNAAYACHDLAEARKLVIEGPAQLPMAALPVETLPSPDGRTHAEYGALLVVPPVLGGANSADAVHLWYVVDDVRAMYHFLSLGVRTWGTLRNLIEGGGLALVEPFSKAYARASSLARALGVYLEQAAVGRGRPVTRATLLESGAVSERQMEKVMSLLAECGGRASPLVESLDAGRAPGFQKKKTADLRDFLEREGYLDARLPRTVDEIRVAALAAVATDIAAGRLTAADIDTLLRRVATHPPESARRPVATPVTIFSVSSPETAVS